jgi:RimJ/RimL family protein N-acetyltransferase
MFLNGDKIYLRPLRKDDIPRWHAWFNDPEITRHMNKGYFPNTEAAQEAFWEKLAQSTTDVQLAIVFKDSGELIGTTGIHKIDWIHRRGDVSVVIGDQKHHRLGVATEAVRLMVRHAFTKLNLEKLTAGMWASNPGSRRCFEKNGFKLEGTLRESYFCQGGYVDELRLGLLRREWQGEAS